MKKNKGLCFRCEHRARFLEGGARPRHECGVIDASFNSCYMFEPVRPPAIKKKEGDDRPHGRYVISGTEPGLILARQKNYHGDIILYHIPENLWIKLNEEVNE